MRVPRFALICCCCCTHAVLARKYPSIETVHQHDLESIVDYISPDRVRRDEKYGFHARSISRRDENDEHENEVDHDEHDDDDEHDEHDDHDQSCKMAYPSVTLGAYPRKFRKVR